MRSEAVGRVDFPTLGDLVDGWIEQHCRIPDGFRRRQPFRQYDWQFWCAANHWRVREDAVYDEDDPPLSQAFTYRRTDIVMAQKALALDTPVATTAGWSTIGDVQVGSFVFDESGRPTRVLSKSRVWRSDTYRVTFSDGASLVACKDHQWWVERRTRNRGYVPMRVRTEDLVGDLREPDGGACRYRVPAAQPIDMPDADLPVPPYTLGAWLGDGITGESRIVGIDDEVFDRIERDGFAVTRNRLLKRRNVVGLIGGLRVAGVAYRKHVPEAYLWASERQRWELLQGLMDTDGHADTRQGRCEFTTVLPELRDGVRALLWSLGVKHVCHEGIARLNGEPTGPKWRISFGARSDMPVFALPRKQGRLKPSGRAHAQYAHRRIVAVERVETVPTQCITVDADSHVFLAGREMIPTCNTGKGPGAACWVCVMAVGPSLFGGWARRGDVYDCADHGCGCGWYWEYEVGEPMGRRHPSPLIQVLATSQDQVDNIWRPLTAMIRFNDSPLRSLLLPREEFIRVVGENPDDPDLDRIDAVTSAATSRLGNPISDFVQDETGIYTTRNGMVQTAETMRRGAAGMQGRGITTTNPWDPAEESTAQRAYEADMPDVFTYFSPPPPELSFQDRRQRRKILEHNYAGITHTNVDAILAECEELMLTNSAGAERFFGNRVRQTAGAWIGADVWDAAWAGHDEVA